MLNEFKREAPHLIPTFLGDGGKTSSSASLNEEEVDLKLARMECDMLKFKLQQSKEIKSIINREVLCYKVAFALCFGLIVYVMAIA